MNPSPERPPYIPQIRLYQDWLATERGLRFGNYDALWRWSVQDLDAFWQSVWDYFDLRSPTKHTAALAKRQMPGAQWFPGAEANYAQQVMRHADAAHAAGFPAIVSCNEKGLHQELSWPELRRQSAALALHLRALGLQPGDRVAAYLPNIPEAMVAFMAVVSIGGVWSLCAPDMGTPAVLDRFKQIEPKLLIACDGVSYGGKDFDRVAVVRELCAALPTVHHVLMVRNLFDEAGFAQALASLPNAQDLGPIFARDDAQVKAFEPMWLPFEHPLWIVYSSGTTGLPKPIVHGHGGTVLMHLSLLVLHNDLGCSYQINSLGERYHWYSSTGWVMWNVQMSGLLYGCTICIFDGNPGGPRDAPDWGTLWRFAADLKLTFLGASAAFFANCMKADVNVAACGDLSCLRVLGSTGSPLSEDAQRWGTEQMRSVRSGQEERSAAGPPQGGSAPWGVGEPLARSAGADLAGVGSLGGDIWWCNMSGGTDFAGAFIGGNRELPLIPGEMQCRLLGCAVYAWNEQGQVVENEVGELVCTEPLPSMPLYFWGDQDNKRYLSSYFDMYPGVWRHGDWLKITPHGGCIIYGRSDATINRHGLRMGTSELYSAVEALPEVLDSLVVDLEYLGRESYMPLFVALRSGLTLDESLRRRIVQSIRTALSPRFVPNDIFQVDEIPRTLTGKKQELPIKKLLLGQSIDKVVNRDAMANPQCLVWYVEFAKQYASRGGAG